MKVIGGKMKCIEVGATPKKKDKEGREGPDTIRILKERKRQKQKERRMVCHIKHDLYGTIDGTRNNWFIVITTDPP